MGELQAAAENFTALEAILWCFYALATLILIEFLARGIDDDDDQGGGKMIPIFQGSES